MTYKFQLFLVIQNNNNNNHNNNNNNKLINIKLFKLSLPLILYIELDI